MSDVEEKLNVLKKKKLTAKTIVEQQRNELRVLKCTLTLNERLEEIYRRFDDKTNLDQNLYEKIQHRSTVTSSSSDQIGRSIGDLSRIIKELLALLSINERVDLTHLELERLVKTHKECVQLIKWKLSDIYANRLADEVSCITNRMNRFTFEDFRLPPELLQGLAAMGFHNGPSDTQALILPYSLDEEHQRNLIVQAKTGTGKTISYIIHILARFQSTLSPKQTLIVVPTIELAFTVGRGIEKMSRYLPNIPITYATSSSTYSLLNTPILIGTIDAFAEFQSAIDFSRVEMLIIDEIDTMIIREDHRTSLLKLIDHLPLENPCQILLYSSTLSEQIMNFTNQLISEPVIIKQRADKQQLDQIEQYYTMCQDEQKKTNIVHAILEQFLQTQTMIFCADDSTTTRLYQELRINHGNDVRMLTTDSNDQDRVALIEGFRSNAFRIFLLSAHTSATTHGIDIDNVSIVINYNVPCSLGRNSDLDYVTYHQRLDRCGRYDKHGYLFNLIQSLDDWNIQLGQQKYFSFVIKSIDIDGIRALIL